MPYGITSSYPEVTYGRAQAILTAARDLEINALDTASRYGQSERFIARFLRENPGWQPRVMTKVGAGDRLYQDVVSSIDVLGDSLWSILIHDPHSVHEWGRNRDQLRRIVPDERVHIGISIYETDELSRALGHDDLSHIQLPLNALDRRFAAPGALEAVERTKKSVFIRSIFLQGLLIDRSAEAPSEELALALVTWWRLCDRLERSAAEVALSYVLQTFPDGWLVIGVEDEPQLREISNAYDSAADAPIDLDALQKSIDTPPWEALDPRRWPN